MSHRDRRPFLSRAQQREEGAGGAVEPPFVTAHEDHPFLRDLDRVPLRRYLVGPEPMPPACLSKETGTAGQSHPYAGAVRTLRRLQVQVHQTCGMAGEGLPKLADRWLRFRGEDQWALLRQFQKFVAERHLLRRREDEGVRRKGRFFRRLQTQSLERLLGVRRRHRFRDGLFRPRAKGPAPYLHLREGALYLHSETAAAELIDAQLGGSFRERQPATGTGRVTFERNAFRPGQGKAGDLAYLAQIDFHFVSSLGPGVGGVLTLVPELSLEGQVEILAVAEESFDERDPAGSVALGRE